MKGLKGLFWKKAVAVILSVAMVLTGVTITPQNVKADATITATNNVTAVITDNSKTGYSSEKDGDLYNYVRYGASAEADDKTGNFVATNAIDGKADTRWANEVRTKGHYITIDLKQSYEISKINISWEFASSIDYKIEVSNDGVSFKSVTAVSLNNYTNAKNRIDTLSLRNTVIGRYVRITDVGDKYIKDSSNNRQHGISIWDVGIFGKDVKATRESAVEGSFEIKTEGETFQDIIGDEYYNYTRYNGVSATASSQEKPNNQGEKFTPKEAIDNNKSTRWSATDGDSAYYVVDLGETYNVEKLYLSWESANATVYNIYKSVNGTDYSLVTTVNAIGMYEKNTATSGNRVDKIEFGTVSARYIKVQAVQRCYKGANYGGGQYGGMSLYEVGVYGTDMEKSYSKKAFNQFRVGNKETIGNIIEAENADEIDSNIKKETGKNVSGQNLGGLTNNTWAEYNINFDRKTSRIYLRYSVEEGNGGKVEVYVDDSTMSTTPVASIDVNSTGVWSNYTDISQEVVVPSGNHKIYLKFVTNKGCVCNLDYFKFEFAPESISGTGDLHEAENAHAFVRGSAAQSSSVESSNNYSGGKAVGKMNTWIEHDRSYLTTYVKAENAGYYQFEVQYAGTMTTLLQYRINSSDNNKWKSKTISSVDSNWENTNRATMQIELRKGLNKIDISGAVWKWADKTETGRTDGKKVSDEWLNIDSFSLTYKGENKKAFNSVLNTDLKGNKIQAEDYNEKSGDDIKNEGSNIGGLTNGKWTEYNINFDRKVSKIYLRNSVRDGNGGKVEVYVDDSTMSGNPAAIVTTSPTGSDWSTYTETATAISIPSGNHEIYLKFVADGSKAVCNLDWFQFEYEPETVKDSGDIHEAENAHGFVQGDAETEHTLQADGKFSNNLAVGGMNAWPDNGRAYLTSYVDVKHPGTYKLTVAYASGSNKDTNIDCRVNSVNDGDWKSISAPTTGGWTTVKKITTEVTLNRGVNVIDITGAANIPYAESNAWQQVNVDYFTLERVPEDGDLAYGKNVEVSGSQSGFDGSNAVDEDEDTRWASEKEGDQAFLIVDLEKLYEIEKVNIMFEKAYPKDFQILVSKDKTNWTVARTVRGFKTTEVDKKVYESDGVCLGKARYVKVRCLNMAFHNAMSIRDIRIYGTKIKGQLSDLALNAEVKVSSSDSSAETSNPANAVDGLDNTRWGAPKTDGNPWYEINLGQQCRIDSVDLKFERAYPKSFRIQISDDGKTWKDYKTIKDWTEPGDSTEIQKSNYYANLEFGNSIHMGDVKTQYIRLYADAKIRDNNWGVSIYEFEVWGTEVAKKDYWSNQAKKTYGIYPVSKLQNTENNGLIDSSLVQGDVIGSGDTYEVVYEPGQSMYFYVNPRDLYFDSLQHTICWSSSNSGKNLWGATSHDESIADYTKQQQATVQYIMPNNIDFGDKDYVETEIGCQIYNKSDLSNGSPKFSLTYKVRIWKSSLSIQDKLSESGSLSVKNPENGATYQWQKSVDGNTWSDVYEKRYDLQILSGSGNGIKNDVVNVAHDLGGGQYYRVRKEGTTQWSHPYKVQYYNDIQNGDFEYPAMFSSDEDNRVFPFNINEDEQQYPNGYEGLMWKTTAPGWNNGPNGNRVGHDIEIVNGRKLKTSGEQEQISQFSVTQDEMYKNNAHGDQFAELNCENVGALYQDILTTPNSQCYWDLDYAGRWCQNSMYVVAMSANGAQNYTTSKQIEALIKLDDVQKILANQEGTKGTTIKLSDGVTATLWKVTSKKTAGQWNDHSGIYNVPAGKNNYLTRFFFVSADGAKRNDGDTPDKTVGSLLDNVKFQQKKDYVIEYYVNGEIKADLTVKGTVNPYDRVSIPAPEAVSNYTLYDAKISGENNDGSKAFYVDDKDRNMTVAYNHNVLKLYYKSGVVVANVKIQGLEELPNDYSVVVNLKNTSGTVLQTHTMSQNEFTKIEKSEGGVEGYFDTATFEGKNLTVGDTYTVEEIIVKNNYLPHYLETVDKNGTPENVGIDKINTDKLSYTATFTYSAGTDNSVNFINIYNPIRKITISKNVSGNMAQQDKVSKSFNFSIKIEKDGNAIDAAEIISEKLTKTGTGQYTFALKHSEKVELYVYNNCKVTVSEDDYSKKPNVNTTIFSDDYYVTSWEKDSKVTDGRIISIDSVNSDQELVCNNVYNDLGDVEVQGFQMNGNKDSGGVSEFSPSFRVVCRVSKKTIKTKKVSTFGVIYAMPKATDGKTKAELKDIMTITNADNKTIKVHEETKDGIYPNWTTKSDSQYSTEYWQYYALTFKCLNYMFYTLQENITVRAYAKMADGTYEYGNNIYTVNMYEIADYLYKNQRMSTLKGHNFLYNNVLNLVTINNNKLDILKSMMKALDVTSTSNQYYNILNKLYKDMNNYVYCQQEYKGKYQEREEFVPKTLTSEEQKKLLSALNDKTGTSYSDINDWIYNQTEKQGKYKGYYKKVQYAWDNGIYVK
ncbi:MAG: discoidin domain-containing protein [Eubacterium sp.]|uniref:discoidin domain-containing protein n=1 Tax=Eubacterium sp. TaxID=142586 RepID=UPI003994A448